MDISDTLAPASDQLDAIELLPGPRIFTIDRVTKGNLEQPVQVHFKNFPRPWRPSKGMRRVLAACWGADASKWGGRSVEVFFDPEVTFGKDKPGGTRIRRLTHIDAAKKIPLLISRGKSAVYVVDPLPETEAKIAELRDEYRTADEERRADIKAEVAVLQNEPTQNGGVA